MAAWMLLLQKQHNRDWMKAYMQHVPAIMAKFGGSYQGVARHVAVAENHLNEGGYPEMDIVGLFSFPTRDDLEAFLASDEYKPYSDLRKANSRSDIFVLDKLITDFGH